MRVVLELLKSVRIKIKKSMSGFFFFLCSFFVLFFFVFVRFCLVSDSVGWWYKCDERKSNARRERESQ